MIFANIYFYIFVNIKFELFVFNRKKIESSTSEVGYACQMVCYVYPFSLYPIKLSFSFSLFLYSLVLISSPNLTSTPTIFSIPEKSNITTMKKIKKHKLRKSNQYLQSYLIFFVFCPNLFSFQHIMNLLRY